MYESASAFPPVAYPNQNLSRFAHCVDHVLGAISLHPTIACDPAHLPPSPAFPAKASSTLSGVMGRSCRRTPMAS